MEHSVFKKRRTQLIDLIKKDGSGDGAIFLFANNDSQQPFVQESSFYYFTGIQEPATVAQINLDGTTRLYIPHTNNTRKQWVQETLETTSACAQQHGVDEIVYLGQPVGGYQFSPLFSDTACATLIDTLKSLVTTQKNIFTCIPTGSAYTQQYLWLAQLREYIPGLHQQLKNINTHVSALRRKKERTEIEKLFCAIQATMAQHAEIAQLIGPDVEERMMQAQLAVTRIAFGLPNAFIPIVAGGKNSTLPHYEKDTGTLKAGDVVIVDCGLQCEHYCADITRTYPVSGSFTPQQQKVYACVLACQQELATHAKAGMFLNNKELPEQSLYHLMINFFEKHGYKDFVVHGVGHFLGLDVHDVGDVHEPLQEGDVITIEPGLYLPHEGFGIRIEDDYWIVPDGAHCLSEELPKTPHDLHKLMTKKSECGSCCSHTH